VVNCKGGLGEAFPRLGRKEEERWKTKKERIERNSDKKYIKLNDDKTVVM